MWCKHYNNILNRFHTIPERSGQTSRRTDRQTDRIAILISRVSVLVKTYSTQEGRELYLCKASKSNFGLLGPWSLTSWPLKLIVSCLAPSTTCANLQQNPFIRFGSIMFTSLVIELTEENVRIKDETQHRAIYLQQLRIMLSQQVQVIQASEVYNLSRSSGLKTSACVNTCWPLSIEFESFCDT